MRWGRGSFGRVAGVKLIEVLLEFLDLGEHYLTVRVLVLVQVEVSLVVVLALIERVSG